MEREKRGRCTDERRIYLRPPETWRLWEWHHVHQVDHRWEFRLRMQRSSLCMCSSIAAQPQLHKAGGRALPTSVSAEQISIYNAVIWMLSWMMAFLKNRLPWRCISRIIFTICVACVQELWEPLWMHALLGGVEGSCWQRQWSPQGCAKCLPAGYLCASSSGHCVNFSRVIYQRCLLHFLNLNPSSGKGPSRSIDMLLAELGTMAKGPSLCLYRH